MSLGCRVVDATAALISMFGKELLMTPSFCDTYFQRGCGHAFLVHELWTTWNAQFDFSEAVFGCFVALLIAGDYD